MAKLRLRSYLIAGLITFLPLWVTLVVFRFVLDLLADLGSPLVGLLVHMFGDSSSQLANLLQQSWLMYLLALILTLLGLYLLGWFAHRVIGRRLLDGFERLLAHIPFVHTIYGSTRKLTSMLQSKPGNTQRVVLVDFPRKGIKVVGLVTRTLTEAGSGREIAAVYIPTTPNPTGGYLELVPTDQLTPTDWSMDEAMAFIISGGAVAPDELPAMPEQRAEISGE